jgi:hypothetical protein
LRSLCVYGGSAYGPQEAALRRGVHVVVGTPGRIQDHIDRGTLKMEKLRCDISHRSGIFCCRNLRFGFQKGSFIAHDHSAELLGMKAVCESLFFSGIL